MAHDEGNDEAVVPRRIYRRELMKMLGFGPTWFRRLQVEGVIPMGRIDPDGRRQWWIESDVDEIIARLKNGRAEAAKQTALNNAAGMLRANGYTVHEPKRPKPKPRNKPTR